MSLNKVSERFHVFISYSREFDLQAAINLQTQLEKAGLNVFRDEGSIYEGDRWLEKLQQAIQQCDSFVLLAGQAGVQRWIAVETEVALIRHFDERDEKSRLPLFPILINQCPVENLPPFMRSIQATQWDGESVLSAKLIERIRNKIPPDSETVIFKGCPFVGLDAYRPDQSALFFGRQQETLQAIGLFDTRSPGKQVNWLEISGNSGSGKSSLMNAGLLPLIQQGWLFARTGIPNWQVLGPFMPGEHPVSNLAGQLVRDFRSAEPTLEKADVRARLEANEKGLADWLSSRKRSDTAFLIAIDQFEELFSIAEKQERHQFDRMLANALKDEDCPLFLLSTVRADFQDRFDKDLPHLLSTRNQLRDSWSLPLIAEQGLREIIDGPSRLAALDASEVRAAILREAENETGALPLVENALEWLWNRSGGKKLSGKDFIDHGGLAGILSQSATRLINGFGDLKPQALELLFSLVKVDAEQRQHTRKRLSIDEAVEQAGGGEKGQQLLERLAGLSHKNGVSSQGSLRLITIADGWVNLIHETLIRSKLDEHGEIIGYWPMFWDYIEGEKDKAPLRQRLIDDALAWSRNGYLTRVIQAPGWVDIRKYRNLARSPLEKSYLKAGKIRSYGMACSLALLMILFAMIVSKEFESQVVHLASKLPEIIRVKTLGPKLPDFKKDMVEIPAGSIVVPKEGKPDRVLKVRQPLLMGKYEVTFEQYDDFVVDTFRLRSGKLDLPDDETWGRKNRPVINVDEYDAMAYSKWLGNQTGRRCTLPTEDEWEYAARAGSTKDFGIPADTNGSDDIRGSGLANCSGCQKDEAEPFGKTTPVGHFPANQWGLHDMHGNVWEWVLNAYDNPVKTSTKVVAPPRVLRGGSWYDDPGRARSSGRAWFNPGSLVGFRVVCSSPITR